MPTKLSELTPEQIRAYKEAGALDAIIEGQKNDVSTEVGWSYPVYAPNSGTPSEGGIFTAPGVRPEMFSTLRQPMDISSIVRPVPSLFAEERVGILTGQHATTGDNPEDSCGEPVRPGNLKTCQQNYIWGEFYIGSQKIKISDAGMIANRAVTPRRVMNEAASNPFFPSDFNGMNVNWNSIRAQQIYQIGTGLRRSFAKANITGSHANKPGTIEGWIREIDGLDSLIVTGHTDAITGETCPSADSRVVDFNDDIFTGTPGGYNITQWITDIYFGMVASAMQLGIQATWAWVMNFAAFRELSYAYANHYYETRSAGVVGNPFQTQQETIRRLQMEMLAGYYLLIDGVQVPVIFSDGIPIDAGGGNYQETDMFLLNTSVNGMDGLHVEYFDVGNQYSRELQSYFNGEFEVLNNGMYLMGAERSFDCMELRVVGKMRQWLEAPFLNAKIQNLNYTSNIAYASPDPGFTGYLNGGSYVLDVNV